MLEIIKEASTLLKDLPDLALYILMGLLFYKVVIIGSIFSFGKLCVSKLHSVLTKEKVVTNKANYGRVSLIDDAEGSLQALLHELHRDTNRDADKSKNSFSFNRNYLHKPDIDKLHTAYKDYKKGLEND